MGTTVQAIVEDYLKTNGYDGLYNAAADCACDLSDLMPCGFDCSACKPGYRVPCRCGENCLFDIVSEKPVKGGDA